MSSRKPLFTATHIAVVAALGSLTAAASAAPPNTTAGSPAHKVIGDLEIYGAPNQGAATLLMMLDNSGSMKAVDIPDEETKVKSQGGGGGKETKCQYNNATKQVPKKTTVCRNKYCWVSVDNRNKITVPDWKTVESITIQIPITDAHGQPLKRKTENSTTANNYFTVKDDNAGTVSLVIKGCKKYVNGQIQPFSKDSYLDRNSKLKLGLIGLLADGTKLSAANKIGIGYYENLSRYEKPASIKRQGAVIRMPVKALTDDYRLKLIAMLSAFQPDGTVFANDGSGNLLGISTPLVNAYAESGAYMMGTTTKHSPPTEPQARAKNKLDPHPFNPSGFREDNYKRSGQAHQEVFTLDPNPEISDANKYLSPINKDDQCSGYGIYFLTDGTPNNVNMRSEIMLLKSLNDSASNLNTQGITLNPFSYDPAKGWDVATKDGPSWLYMGAYAKRLRNPSNPSGKVIKTATVGFGKSFDNFHITKLYKGKTILDCDAIAPDKGAQTSNHNNTSLDAAKKKLAELRKKLKDLETTLALVQGPGGLFFGNGGFSLGRPFLIRQQINETHAEISKWQQTITNLNGASSSASGDGANNNDSTNTQYSLFQLALKNLCLLGSQDKDYGQGGFTATSDPDSLAESVKNFVGELSGTIPAAPAGTISIPKDPLSISNLMPYAYLPMVQAQPNSTAATWKGNLKKYHTLDGTLYGKNSQRLYTTSVHATSDNQSYPIAINTHTQDLWQKDPAPALANTASIASLAGTGVSTAVATAAAVGTALIETGGSYDHIPSPSKNDINTVRTVFVENCDGDTPQKTTSTPTAGAAATTTSCMPASNGSSSKKTSLLQVSIKNKKLEGFDKLDRSYTLKDIAYLMNFLGFNVPVSDESFKNASKGNIDYTRDELIESYNKILETVQLPDRNPRVLGGVVHSVPTLASYSGEFEDDGNITSDESKRDDYLLYGSMDGALHLIKASDGSENFSFIPREMFKADQVKALAYNSNDGKQGIPAFGVDAPWSVHAIYSQNIAGKKITANEIYAYGGLRMGGTGLYALNIKDKQKPQLMFVINDKTQGFERMGQTWARPLPATIKLKNEVKDVLIFGGGYDMCYEDPQFKLVANNTAGAGTNNNACTNKTQAQGNAVYMVDAKTGTLIKAWTASNNSNTANSGGEQYMKHSIVSEIAPVDRNNNGYVDHLYFADLGGQVFRIDLQEDVDQNSISKRVVKLFDANEGVNHTNHIPYRFYDRPAISVYHNEQRTTNAPSSRFAVINIASGDRSSPLSKHRQLTDANRIYGIFDDDIADPSLFGSSYTLKSNNLKTDQLMKHDPKDIETKSDDDRANMRKQLAERTKKGWYYDLTRFGSVIGVPYLKAVGAGYADASIYHASIYSPEYKYTTDNDTCAPNIIGGTERQMYCLPWGICAKEDGKLIPQSKNGTLGYIKGGAGIQELSVGSVTKTVGNSSRFRVLIGNELLGTTHNNNANPKDGGFKDSTNANTLQTGAGTGSSKEGERLITGEKFIMDVKRWYDLQLSENK